MCCIKTFDNKNYGIYKKEVPYDTSIFQVLDFDIRLQKPLPAS